MGEPREDQVADSPRRRPRLGMAVEGIALLCFLAALIGLGIGVIAQEIAGSDASPGTVVFAWENAVPALGGSGLSWELFLGGLLLCFHPRAMAGTQLAELARHYPAPSRRVALVMVWVGAYIGAFTIASYVTDLPTALPEGRVSPLIALAGFVALLGPICLLGVPPLGRRRRGE